MNNNATPNPANNGVHQPASLPPIFDVHAANIPSILQQHGAFCVWKGALRGGKIAKIPHNPRTEALADVSDRSTFGTFAETVAAYNGGGYDGIGIRVDYGLAAIDIDHCIDSDGNLSEPAQKIIRAMNGSYCEISPSGRGIRIICLFSTQFVYDKARYFMKNAALGIETYIGGQTERYVTLTGNILVKNGCVDYRDAELQSVLDDYMRRPSAAQSGTVQQSQQQLYAATGHAKKLTQDDELLIEQLKNSDSGERFEALISGDLSEYGGDHSSADMALVNMLAARTDDGAQIDRILRNSGLMRAKWDSPRGSSTYGAMTINRALEDAAEYRTQAPPAIALAALTGGPAPLPVQQQPPAPAAQQQQSQQQSTAQQVQQPPAQTASAQPATPAQPAQPAPTQPVAQQQAASSGHFTTLEDILNSSYQPVQFLVDSILPVGLTLLVAPPKSGKSWMSLWLSIALTLGWDFMGYPVQSCGVLYLALEDSRPRIKSRAQRLLCGQTGLQGVNVEINAPALDADPQGLIEYIGNYIKHVPGIKLIIIDTFQKIRGMPRGKETLYAADYREVAKLKAFADEHGIGIILVHHTRKQKGADPFEAISGTNGIMAAADTAWVLEKKRKNGGKNRATLHVTGRDVDCEDYELEMDDKTSRWDCLGTVDDVAQAAYTDAYEELILTIRELLDTSPAGGWDGQAADLLDAGRQQGRLLDMSATKIGQRLKLMDPQLLKSYGIEYTSVSANGNAGRRHCFAVLAPTVCDDEPDGDNAA